MDGRRDISLAPAVSTNQHRSGFLQRGAVASLHPGVSRSYIIWAGILGVLSAGNNSRHLGLSIGKTLGLESPALAFLVPSKRLGLEYVSNHCQVSGEGL